MEGRNKWSLCNLYSATTSMGAWTVDNMCLHQTLLCFIHLKCISLLYMAFKLLYYKPLKKLLYYSHQNELSSQTESERESWEYFTFVLLLKKKQTETEENSGQKLLDVKKDSRNSLTEILWPPTYY